MKIRLLLSEPATNLEPEVIIKLLIASDLKVFVNKFSYVELSQALIDLSIAPEIINLPFSENKTS